MFDGCVETQKGPKTARPGQLHPIREFNDLIGIDGFYWKGKRDFQVHVIHCIDEGSLFHLGKRNDRGANLTQGLLEDMWFSWAKAPSSLYSDPAGEFISERWLDFLQEHNIKPELTSEAWRRGRVERHGGVIKDMLTRMDAEQPFENTADFDMALRKCFQSKNSMIKHNGFSPEQIVLGKATKLPASLTCDEDLAAHSLAGSDTPEGLKFLESLNRREQARRAFLQADNNAAARRALVGRSRPHRGDWQSGQWCLYWRRRSNGGRMGVGRWHGPAQVVASEGQSVVWVSHCGRLL